MTTNTTLPAPVCVLTFTGRGSDGMVPRAVPGFVAMAIVLPTVYVVPAIYGAAEEWKRPERSDGPKANGAS